MKTLKLVRALREGFVSFYRDKWLTLATISVMMLTLFLIGLTVFLSLAVQSTIAKLEKRINISVYFNFDVEESEILAIRDNLEKGEFSEIEKIEFISRAEALERFKGYAGDDPDINKALEVVGENPLPDALVITASDPDDYESINNFFEQEYAAQISSTSFQKNKGTISQLRDRMVFIRDTTSFLSILFIVIAGLVTFNTVRMSIYAHRKEFEVMRLVGASNTYVKIPVICEGVLYGLVSAVLAIIALLVAVYLVNPFAQKLMSSANITELYFTQAIVVIASILIAGVGLGAVSSYIAIRRYLEK
jgi:cell division transport system permease protein